MWGRSATLSRHPAPCGPTYQPRRYVGFPPPPRMHLRRCLRRFDPRAHVGPLGLYNLAPASPPRHKPHLILRAEKPGTLIHMSTRIRASNQEKISPL